MHKLSKIIICIMLFSSLFLCHTFVHASYKAHKHINLENIIPRYQVTSNSLDELIRNDFNFKKSQKGLNNSRLLGNALTINHKYHPAFYFPLTRQTIRVSNNIFSHRFTARDIDYRQKLNHAWYKTNLDYSLTPRTLTITKHTYLLPKLFRHGPYYQLNNKDGYIKGIPVGIDSVSYKIHLENKNKLIFYPYAYKNDNHKYIHIKSREQAKHQLILHLSKYLDNNQYAPAETTNNIRNKTDTKVYYDNRPKQYF